MESSLVLHEDEEGGVERKARRGGKNTRFSYNLSLIVASLCTSYCSFIPPCFSRLHQGAGIESPFCPGHCIRERLLHPCFAPASLRYDVVKFYRSQNFLTSLFLNINETVSPVVLFQLYFNFFHRNGVISIHISDECESTLLPRVVQFS